MFSSGIYQNSIHFRQTGEIHAENKCALVVQTSPAQNSARNIPFTSSAVGLSSPTTPNTFNLRTELTTKEEKEKYSQLVANLDTNGRKNLETLLKTGQLLRASAEDGSNLLDNSYKILTATRATGLDPSVILEDLLEKGVNTSTISQTAEDIPKKYVDAVIKTGKTNPKIPNDEINENTIDVKRTGTCVAASIEFRLAKENFAEFSRFVERLTSPDACVYKTIHLNNLADNTLDAIYLLNIFEIPYEMKDFKTARLKLTPDVNAMIRAQIQNSNKDPHERSLIDVLMQSTFMNVGSQQCYDSLTDRRGGKFSQSDKGLIEFEKTFVESIVFDKNEISVTYQTIDENGKLTGREFDTNITKKHILETLAEGKGVVIGYTSVNRNKDIIESHEITIVDVKPGKNGKLIFICADSDDGNPNYIEYPENYIIPKIHHAGLPKEVAEKDVKFTDAWVEGMNYYKEAKNNPQTNDLASQ